MFSGYFITTAQETFKTDSIISDTIYYKIIKGKIYEYQTVLDRKYNTVTSVTEVTDMAAYMIELTNKLANAEIELQMIEQEINSYQQQIVNQRRYKGILDNRINRLKKQIRIYRKKINQ